MGDIHDLKNEEQSDVIKPTPKYYDELNQNSEEGRQAALDIERAAGQKPDSDAEKSPEEDGKDGYDKSIHYTREILTQEWAKFIKQWNEEWNWYCHLTFRGYPHPEQADKVWSKWLHIMNREIFGVKYWKRRNEDGVIWARGTELQRRGAIHYHALIGRIPNRVRRLTYMDRWFDIGGIARIQGYNEKGGAEEYITKSCYAFKRGEVDLGGPLNYRQQLLFNC